MPGMMKRITRTLEGRISFRVRLVPRAPRDEVVGWAEDGLLKVKVTAPPVDRAANEKLLSFLADELGARKSDVGISSGFRSRLKRLQVPAFCENRLLSYKDI